MSYELLSLGIGKLGYGNMRLPKQDGKIDFDTIYSMIDAFLASGNSYFDTAYLYENSEEVLREGLVRRHPRDSFQIATKASLLNVEKPEEMVRQLNVSLDRLGLDSVDLCLLHGLTAPTIEKADRFDAWNYLQSLKNSGKTRYIGFSFHGTPEELDALLSAHPEIDYVQLQINYLDWENPKVQSRRLHEVTLKHQVPFSVMEPNKGGWLASEESDAGKLLKSINPDVSVASWAFRYVLGLEGLFVCLSGMGNLAEVEDNINTFATYTPLNSKELDSIQTAVEILNALPSIPCTRCCYCLANCPMKIRIPDFINLYNGYQKYKNLDTIKHIYGMLTTSNEGKRPGCPGDCIACGRCEKSCPQHLNIPDIMADIRKIVE